MASAVASHTCADIHFATVPERNAKDALKNIQSVKKIFLLLLFHY